MYHPWHTYGTKSGALLPWFFDAVGKNDWRWFPLLVLLANSKYIPAILGLISQSIHHTWATTNLRRRPAPARQVPVPSTQLGTYANVAIDLYESWYQYSNFERCFSFLAISCPPVSSTKFSANFTIFLSPITASWITTKGTKGKGELYISQPFDDSTSTLFT
ncbi:MAG: hypothetical protein NXY57DRAFT_119445 [Lentinula lateritia]|nr:MAG: hypothetical protein NXY57DRAFT_119445 [Lentinula lateritia]